MYCIHFSLWACIVYKPSLPSLNILSPCSHSVLDEDGSLLRRYTEYIDGARIFLESDNDKDNQLLTQIKTHFCNFVKKLIESFTRESREGRGGIFLLVLNCDKLYLLRNENMKN